MGNSLDMIEMNSNGRIYFVTEKELERSHIEQNCFSSRDEYFNDMYCSNGTCEGCPVYERRNN